MRQGIHHHPKSGKNGRLEEAAYVFGPWHPAVIQFPVVGSILACLTFWGGQTYQVGWLSKMAGTLWLVVPVTAFLGLLTGHLFAHRLGRYIRWSPLPPPSTGPLHFHALLATIAFGCSLFTFTGALHILRDEPLHLLTQFFFGIAAAVFFSWGSHEGGEMTFKIETVPLSAPQALKAPRTVHRKAYRKAPRA